MAQSIEVCIVLNKWIPEKKGWLIPSCPDPKHLTVSSIKTSEQEELSPRDWEIDRSGDEPLIKWISETAPPRHPIVFVRFARTTRKDEVWLVINRLNKLTGILVLLGTLGTAYFAYLGNESQKEADRLTEQVKEWRDNLRPLQCSDETDAPRAVSECLSKYARDKHLLEDAESRIEALPVAPPPPPCQ